MSPSYKEQATKLFEYGLICLHFSYIKDLIIKNEELDIITYIIGPTPDSVNHLAYQLESQSRDEAYECGITQNENLDPTDWCRAGESKEEMIAKQITYGKLCSVTSISEPLIAQHMKSYLQPERLSVQAATASSKSADKKKHHSLHSFGFHILPRKNKSAAKKHHQASLNSFGFYISPRKSKKMERKVDPVTNKAISSSSMFSSDFFTEQTASSSSMNMKTEPNELLPKKPDTKRGLAKIKTVAKDKVVIFPVSMKGTADIHVVLNDGKDLDWDSNSLDSKIKVINSATKTTPLSLPLTHQCDVVGVVDTSQVVSHVCDARNTDSDLMGAKLQKLHCCSMANSGMVSKLSDVVTLETEFIPLGKQSQISRQASVHQNPKTPRSLFESMSEFVSELNTKVRGSNSVSPFFLHMKNYEFNTCPLLELPVKEEMLNISENKISKGARPLKNGICDNLSVPASNLAGESSTSALFVESISTDIKTILNSDTPNNIDAQVGKEVSSMQCFVSNTSVKEKCDKIAPVLSQPYGKVDKVYDERNVNVSNKQSASSPSGWPLTYTMCIDSSSYTDKPSLPIIYGECMESNREMGFSDYALTHARPTGKRAPTKLILSELFQLIKCGGIAGDQAVMYLRSWLSLCPPVTLTTQKLYSEAFQLNSESSSPLEVINWLSNKTHQSSSAVMALEYFVSMFEINFDFVLRSGNKGLKRNCLLIKWLWSHSYAVVQGRSVQHLVQQFEKIISAPELNLRACAALCALLSIVCECLRLASVQWDQRNPKFDMDSVVTLASDLGRIISSLCIPCSNTEKVVIINLFRPTWLRSLLAAAVLSSYSDYLLSRPVHVNRLSLSSIVSQFFFLVPPLELCDRLCSVKGKENVKLYNQQGDNSQSLEFNSDLTKNKIPRQSVTANKVNKKNCKGENAIHLSCIRNKPLDLQKFLTIPGADVNMPDNCGWTPLHEACSHGSYACVELLLKYVPTLSTESIPNHKQKQYKVDINAVGPDGLTPLHDAVIHNKIDVCKLLLLYGGKKLLESKTAKNCTAMDLAQSEEMRSVLSSCIESTPHDLSLSELESASINPDIVSEVAPLAVRYKELRGPDSSRMVSLARFEEFLMLLSILVSSYFAILESLQACGQPDYLHAQDKDVLTNMDTYMRFLKRHVRKLTSPKDYESLQIHLHILDFLCVNGPRKDESKNVMNL